MNVDCLYPVGRHFVVRYVCITKTMQDEDIDTEHCVCLLVGPSLICRHWCMCYMLSVYRAALLADRPLAQLSVDRATVFTST